MKRFVLRNEKDARYVAGQIVGLNLEKPIEVTLKYFHPRRTTSQNSLMWKWHAEVAASINLATDKMVNADWVHYEVFTPKFLPGDVIVLPDNTETWAPDKTSSKLNTAEMTAALDQYLAWCIEWGIELTVPEATG